MDYIMLKSRFREWMAELKQLPAVARSEPAPATSLEWCAGLVVNPASFSRQLGDMQVSLLRANLSRPERKVIATGPVSA